MRWRVLEAVMLAAVLAGCAGMKPPDIVASNEAQYVALYPYYAEVCAVSQIQKKPGFGADIRGGPGGHAVLYLNGVCRDRGANYPTVKLCDGAPAEGQGVGLSVNAHYRNANWVAVEGRDFFYGGDLGPTERLTRLAYRRAQEAAQAQGVLDGVQFHDVVFDDMPPGTARRDWMYEVSIGTDYAVGFARDRYCARVPLSRARMGRVVGFLNDLNAPYRDGRKTYEWSVLANNCSHTIHNALSAVGIWEPWETDRFVLISAFDFPVPKNELVNLLRRTNDLPLDDPAALYGDPAARAAVLADGVVPTAPGALASFQPVIRDNDVYDTDLSLIFYDEPVFGGYEPRLRAMFAEPRYIDLAANLRHFAEVYRRAHTRRYNTVEPTTTPNRHQLQAFYDSYFNSLERDGAATDAALAGLRGR
ncbi:MAG: hypothetical protein HY060_09415 [Proteobacteria bacterium]|nr:hypothetical protein [Pseudomonadota bacterium]